MGPRGADLSKLLVRLNQETANAIEETRKEPHRPAAKRTLPRRSYPSVHPLILHLPASTVLAAILHENVSYGGETDERWSRFYRTP